MGTGIANFLESTRCDVHSIYSLTPTETTPNIEEAGLVSENISILDRSSKQNGDIFQGQTLNGDSVNPVRLPCGLNSVPRNTPLQIKEEPIATGGDLTDSVFDKIQSTLDHAAKVLRESLELTVGGVVFLDTSIGYFNDHESAGSAAKIEHHFGRDLSNGSIRDSTIKHRRSKVQAVSTASTAKWDAGVLDGKSLQSLIKSYPKGSIWYIDEKGYFESLEQVNGKNENDAPIQARAKALAKHQADAELMSKVFHGARQIMFIPLWDAANDRWYSGCFVWTRSVVPVFSIDTDLSYLSTFSNSVMVEINRLDVITANKMKSDFISSISHEFRSPLHGILASAEFLRQSHLDASQIEFISTIQNCSGTLLDTINHVLDYSKINSFEKIGNQQDTISNEIYHKTNLALLCEDIVNGMIAANKFRGVATDHLPLPAASDAPSHNCNSSKSGIIPDASLVRVILDIDHLDWDFKIQAGAFRRVIMNIFGNAQKYTETGYILVRLGIQDTDKDVSSSRRTISLKIRDSGKGISPEYMERKLYQPFAQENSFATGIGLGLSIVWSIVNQLGGKIHIRSELGKGTEVEVTLPLNRADELEEIHTKPGDLTRVSEEAQEAVLILRERVNGQSVQLTRFTSTDHLHESKPWNCIEQYCSDWFGYQIVKTGNPEQVCILKLRPQCVGKYFDVSRCVRY
jgi:signal transduction histidine kinase